MGKTFIVERAALIRQWELEFFEIEDENEDEAIISIRKATKDKTEYLDYKFKTKTLPNTREVLTSNINVDTCIQIPTQQKLNF